MSYQLSSRERYVRSIRANRHRPKLNIKTTTNRQLKDNGYAHIKACMFKHNIERGAYLGLAAAHPDHIAAELGDYVVGFFDSCEIDEAHYPELRRFYKYLNNASRQNKKGGRGLCYNLRECDIFHHLKNSDFEYPYSVIDLDFPGNLNHEIIHNMVELLPSRTTSKAIIALWNMYGRKNTELEHENLIQEAAYKLQDNFKVTIEKKYTYTAEVPMWLQPIVIEEREDQNG